MIPTLALDSAGQQTNSGTPTGSIVGGVVGGCAGIALIVAGLVFYKRRHKRIPAATFDDDEFYGDPYRQNNLSAANAGGEWSGEEFVGGFPGTGEQHNTRTLDNDDYEDEYYRQQNGNRRSWWSSVSTLFHSKR